MEILSTADWQDSLLAFHKLDGAFENDKCRNSDTDFQRNSESTRKKQQGAKWNRIKDALVTKKS